MSLEEFIETTFEDGLTYNEMAQLCIRVFCSVQGIPGQLHEQCNKNTIANTCASLVSKGFVKGDTVSSTFYGARMHEVTDKGHWIEVMASVLKKGNVVDELLSDQLLERLTRRSSGR